jgi:hypothetical protein
MGLLGVLFILLLLLQSLSVMKTVSNLFDCESLNIRLYFEVYGCTR